MNMAILSPPACRYEHCPFSCSLRASRATPVSRPCRVPHFSGQRLADGRPLGVCLGRLRAAKGDFAPTYVIIGLVSRHARPPLSVRAGPRPRVQRVHVPQAHRTFPTDSFVLFIAAAAGTSC